MKHWILVLAVFLSAAWASTASKPSLTCDFERDLCDWRLDSSSSYIMWKRRRRRLGSRDSGPTGDHTTGNGYYMVMQTHRYATARLSLRSPDITTSHETCLSFWYQMHGYDVGGLVVNKREANQNRELFRIFGPQGDRWYKAFVNTGTGKDFKLEIQASYYDGHLGLGDIAIDDVNFSDGNPCQPDDVTTYTYIQMSNQQPASRHLLGYTLLRSPTVSIESKGGCLSFWYKVKGNYANVFAVQKYDYGEGPEGRSEKLFVAPPGQSEVWIHQHVTLPVGYHMYIAFLVSINVSGDGFVALDDVSLNPKGSCPEDSQKSFADCDFETDLCQWYLATDTKKEDWIRTQEATPTNNTGPSRDHTTGAGFYLYLDGSSVKEANLYSPILTVGPLGACLRFWYYMYGEDVYRLQLTLHQRRNESNATEGELLCSLEGSHQAKWTHQHVSIPTTKDSHLIFTAMQGYFPRCNIAIDDVTISFNGRCEEDDRKVEMTSSALMRNDSTVSVLEAAPTNISVIPETTLAMPQLTRPNVTLIAVTDPAHVNSPVEIICSHTFEHVRYSWYKLQGEMSEIILLPNYYHMPKQFFQQLYEMYERLAGEEEASLVFPTIQFWEAGTYKCALDSEGFLTTESESVEIRVGPDPRPSPVLTSDSPTDPALMGVTIRLVCGRKVARATYFWHTDSSAFASSPIPSVHTLSLNNSRPSHNGIYTCQIAKDGYSTSRSNALRVRVVPGKPCTNDADCSGSEYLFKCLAKRCLCNINTALVDQKCRQRPKPAVLRTWPSFQEFFPGETFFLVCDFGPVTPKSLLYTFVRSGRLLPRDEKRESYNIYKVTNATSQDSGDYQCYVTFNKVDSFRSRPIKVLVKVKESIDLNCEFSDGLCNWFQGESPDSGNFTLENVLEFPNTGGLSLDGADQYLRLDPSDARHVHRATLLSPLLDQTTQDSCLNFRYRLHGSQVYSLTVWKVTFSPFWQEDAGERLWTAIGQQERVWMKQKVTIPKADHFYIMFEAIGDVAIDDVIFQYRC